MHGLKKIECGGMIFQTLSLKNHDILKYVCGGRINSLKSFFTVKNTKPWSPVKGRLCCQHSCSSGGARAVQWDCAHINRCRGGERVQ